jgi:seryl-tRNA synthetase
VAEGIEKFVELENRVYRAIELYKALRAQKEALEKDLGKLKSQLDHALAENDRLKAEFQESQKEKELVRVRVEKILKSLEKFAQDGEVVET